MSEIRKTVNTAGISVTLQQLEAIGIKPGQQVVISRWYPVVSNKQKALFFCYLTFCIDHGLRNKGHFSTDGLYQDIKAWARDTYPADFRAGVRLSRMNNERFDLFIKLVDTELMQGFFEIDTSEFWADYQDWKNSGTEQDYPDWKAGRAA